MHCSLELSPLWYSHVICPTDIKQAEGGKQRLCAYLCTKSSNRQTPSEQEKTPLCQRLSGCKPKSGCFFHPVYRGGYSLLLPLQITACLADLNIAIKPFPSFCLSHYCAAEASGLIAHGGRCCPIHLPLPLHCSGRNRGLVWRVCVTTTHGKHSRLYSLNPKSTTHTAAQLWSRLNTALMDPARVDFNGEKQAGRTEETLPETG